MKADAKLGVGVIGMGFMGQTHAQAYRAADPDGFACELVAVCDLNVDKLNRDTPAAGNLKVDRTPPPTLDFANIKRLSQAADILNDERVHIVSICTPTDSHVDLAIRALEAGKHVLVEKPVAINSHDVRRLIEAAARSQTLCMPAMCMRFWPGWTWLHDRIVDGTLGDVRSAVFQRLGSRPNWNDFYGDPSRSGGALFDLHIHDADFIYWCFGQPQSIQSNGTIDHMTNRYQFQQASKGNTRDLLQLTAEGGWDREPGAPFCMKFQVTFEEATADFEFGRTPSLLLHRKDSSEVIECDSLTGYDHEIRHFVSAIQQGRGDLRATLDDALAVTMLLEDEKRRLAR